MNDFLNIKIINYYYKNKLIRKYNQIKKEEKTWKKLVIPQNNLLTNEEIKAEEILDEDITMKMKRVLKQNELSHYFRHWKSVVQEKNKKPKFFDVINIIMKCLFTDNKYVKAAFMGETYFII